jgi:hypothetical protein
MPRLSLNVAHQIGQDEAARRLKEKFAAARAEFRDTVKAFRDNWTGHTFSFSLQAMGLSVGGTVVVEPQTIRLNMTIPMAAMLFKRQIEDRIRREIASAVTSDRCTDATIPKGP